MLLFSHPVMSDSLWSMDSNTSGFSVPHHLPKFAQVHVHCISDAIQPSHPQMAFSPSFLNLSQHQTLFQWSVVCIRWPKYWSFIFSISPSNEYSRLISLKIDGFALLAVQQILRSLLQNNSSKASILWGCAFFMVQLSQPYPLGRQPWLYGPLLAEWCLCFSTHCLGLS